MNLNVAFKRENFARNILNILAAAVGQWFPMGKCPSSAHTHQLPKDARLSRARAGKLR
jgi:hypothetical protein